MSNNPDWQSEAERLKSENAELRSQLERFTALEEYLPESFAIGDDATADLAVEMMYMQEAHKREIERIISETTQQVLQRPQPK